MKRNFKSQAVAALKSQKGAVLIIMALCLIVFLMFAAIVVDLGWQRYAGVQLQAAVDAAALAGADSLDIDADTVRAQAVGVAGVHRIAGRHLTLPPANIEIGDWDETNQTFTPSVDDLGEAVRVNHRINDVTTFIGPIFGHDRLAIERSAVAGLHLTGAICGVLADTYAKVNGAILFDSYDSTEGTYEDTVGANGGICSNQDVVCNGAVDVNGSLLAGPSGELDSDCDVSGDEGHLPAEVPLPEVDCSEAAAHNDNDQVAAYVNGLNFRANAQADFEFPPGLYYFENFTINAGADVRINDEVVVCIENGTATINGDAITNLSEDPHLFTVMAADDSKITLNGNAAFYGSFIAPYSDEVKLNGNMDYYGVVVADEVVMNGNLDFHADESLMEELGLVATRIQLLL